VREEGRQSSVKKSYREKPLKLGEGRSYGANTSIGCESLGPLVSEARLSLRIAGINCE